MILTIVISLLITFFAIPFFSALLYIILLIIVSAIPDEESCDLVKLNKSDKPKTKEQIFKDFYKGE